MKPIRRIALLLGAIACFAMSACDNKHEQAKEIALKAIERFHQEFNDPNSRNFHIAHVSEQPEETKLRVNAIQKAQTRLGSFETATVTSCNTTSRPAGVVVDCILESKFERGSATERFSFLVSGRSAVPQGYSIESPLLDSQ